MKKTANTVADPRGTRDPRSLLLIHILSFSCSFQQKFCEIIGWRPPPPRKLVSNLGNPGSATELCATSSIAHCQC